MKRLRAAITWGVLGLFAATMVCGEGLHCLCGFHHSSCLSHTCGLYGCGHSGHESPESGGRVSLRASAHDNGLVSEADCPICSFFASAHCLPILPLTLCEPLTAVERVAVARCPDVGNLALVYRSRAPPAAAL